MQHRNVLSLLRRLAGVTLGLATLAGIQPAHAQSVFRLPLISLIMPSLNSEPEAPTPEAALTVHELPAAYPFPQNVDLTNQPNDLWIRIRNGFAMADLNDDLTLHYQQYYQNRPDALRRMVERSRPIMHHIVEELEARGMPTELALLPMVESSFNPMAYSRAHAAGLWQFIPATGKRFNLEQNWWQDQRRDIVASTSAALDYLQSIYEMHGDWHLALASYNWGEGAVKRAVEKNIARDLPTDYASLNMPNETRHYVPKLQALKNIFNNPRLMAQLNIPSISNRPYFTTVETARAIDVKTAARLANMPMEAFVALNPSHNRPVIKAATPLVIPEDKLATFQSNLERTSAPLTEWEAYTLKSGERLHKVAPRFGISLPELLRINGLSGKIKLGGGSTILVPSGQGASDLSLLGRNASLPQIIEPEPAPKSTPRPPEKPGKKESGKSADKQDSKQASGKNSSKSGSTALPTKSAAKPAAGKTAPSATASSSKGKSASSKPAAATPAKTSKPAPGKKHG